MKYSLRDRLYNYLLRQHDKEGWFPSGELQRIAAEKTTYTPQNVGRRLRELETAGMIEVKYVKNHAYYRAVKQEPVAVLTAKSLQWFELLP